MSSIAVYTIKRTKKLLRDICPLLPLRQCCQATTPDRQVDDNDGTLFRDLVLEGGG
jgi:hypothetical protein